MWVGTWTFQSGMGGPPSDPFRTAASLMNVRTEGRRQRGLARRWRTSAVGDGVLDSMNGRFQGPCGGLRPAGGGNRAGLRCARLSGPAASRPRRGGRRAPFPQRYPSCPGVRRSWGCSPRSSASLACMRSRSGGHGRNGLRGHRFQPGTVNGQGGWKSAVPGDIPSLPNGYDQAVVANSGAPAAFGGQSLRMSNAYNPAPDTSPPEYTTRPIPSRQTDAAGDSQTNTEYTAQFSFISFHPDRQQPGLHIRRQSR